MQIINTHLEGCFIVQPRIYTDSRGYFYECFNQKKFAEATGHDIPFVQDNESFSTYGILRGLHAQSGQFAQSKLVRVIEGEVLDVAVDVRPTSSTFGEHLSLILSGENKKQLFIPRGFLHGFVVLSEQAVFAYKCDNYYQNDAEVGIRYNDPALNISWEIPREHIVLSEKDKHLPLFKDRYTI